ncbi:MAG: hypothetical protein N2254_09065 [bacterium]|nr:hypothetical protein [bacterium]
MPNKDKKLNRRKHLSSDEAKLSSAKKSRKPAKKKKTLSYDSGLSELGVKIKKVDIPNFSRKYRISIRITGDLSHFKVPQFLSSILSMGKIPVGTLSISATKSGNTYDFFVDFFPSPILSVLTKHEKFAYRSSVFFDEKQGFLTKNTSFLEKKTDGREFVRQEDFGSEYDNEFEVNKDPIAFFLDLVSIDFKDFSEKLKENEGQDFRNPFDVRNLGNEIFVYPKDPEFKDFFSAVEIALHNLTSDLKIPQRFLVKGLFSLFDIAADSD